MHSIGLLTVQPGAEECVLHRICRCVHGCFRGTGDPLLNNFAAFNKFFKTSSIIGTGKSLLLRAIIAALRRKHANKADVISVTASTGMAASNIGGAFPFHAHVLE